MINRCGPKHPGGQPAVGKRVPITEVQDADELLLLTHGGWRQGSVGRATPVWDVFRN